MLFRSFIRLSFLFVLLLPVKAFSEVGLVGGIYYDTFNEFNVRTGIKKSLRPYDEEVFGGPLDPNFILTEVELGTHGEKIAIGVGSYDHHGSGRWVLSYSNIDKQKRLGLEIVTSFMGLSFKLGAYSVVETTGFMAYGGIGFGI